jgi:hypothetical protein
MCRIAFFGVACALAIWVASCAREERDCVLFTAGVLAVNWLLFASYWIYAPASPAFLLYAMGVQVRHEDTWALVDLASLVAVGWRCRNVWWSPILWSVYLVTLTMHVIARANDLMYLDYDEVLDAALIIQLAVIFMLGGGGCADRLSDCWRGVRGMGRSAGGSASAAVSACEASR